MNSPAKVVVHLLDGRVIKGRCQNFNPARPFFHLYEDGKGVQENIRLEMKEIKAVFFVRCYMGNARYDDNKTFDDSDRRPHGQKVEVVFADNEVMRGSAVGYDPRSPGFFLIPADPASNNIRVFVVSGAIRGITFLKSS